MEFCYSVFEFIDCIHVCLLNKSAIEILLLICMLRYDTPPNLHVVLKLVCVVTTDCYVPCTSVQYLLETESFLW